MTDPLSPCLTEDQLLSVSGSTSSTMDQGDLALHLERCPRCTSRMTGMVRSLVDSGAEEETGDGAPVVAELAPELAPGTSVGRYVVLERLAQGAMGTVYSAYDPQLDRRVALKVMLPGRARAAASSALGRDQLIQEARAMARISHPNVVSVYDAGKLGEQELFIAMELVTGGTLRHWLKSAQRRLPEIARVFHDAALGLKAAHEAGLIHRDFKPDNVLIGEDGRVRVTDFGIALVGPKRHGQGSGGSGDAGPGSGTDSSEGSQGGVAGTPAYMAPEQGKRDAHIEAGADQYAFCVTLFEALYGRRPRPPVTQLSQLPAQSTSGARVSKRLRRVLLKGLAEERSARHADMRPLLAALEPTRPVRSLTLAAAAGVVLVAVGAAVAARRQADAVCEGSARKLAGVWDVTVRDKVKAAMLEHVSGAERHWALLSTSVDAYAEHWLQLHQDACLATHKFREASEELLDRRNDCLDRRLERLAALTSQWAAGRGVQRAVAATDGLPELEVCNTPSKLGTQQTPRTPELLRRVGALRQELAKVHALYDIGEYESGERQSALLLEQARQVAFAPLLAEALLALGRFHSRRGRSDEASELTAEALSIGVESGQDYLAAEAAVDYMGDLVYASFEPARQLQFIAIAESHLRLVEPRPRLRTLFEMSVARILRKAGRNEQALERLRKVLGEQEGTFSAASPLVGNGYYTLGLIHTDLHRFQEARAAFARSRLIGERLFGEWHPGFITIYDDEIDVLKASGLHEELVVVARRALALNRRFGGKESMEHASIQGDLAFSLAKLGHAAEARRLARAGLEESERVLGSDHQTFLTQRVERADTLLILGDVKESLEETSRVLSVLATKSTASAQLQAMTHLVRGEGALEQRQLELGQRAFEEVLALRSRPGVDGAVVARALFGLAKAKWERGAKEEAERAAREALAFYREQDNRAWREWSSAIEGWLAARGAG